MRDSSDHTPWHGTGRCRRYRPSAQLVTVLQNYGLLSQSIRLELSTPSWRTLNTKKGQVAGHLSPYRDPNLILQDSFTPKQAREVAETLLALAEEVAPAPKKPRSRPKPKVD